MTVKESSPWKIQGEKETVYFCSDRCQLKYAKEQGIDLAKAVGETGGLCCSAPGKPWYQNKTLLIALVLSAAVGFSYAVPALVPFREALVTYFQKVWWAILLGFTIGGVIEYYVPREYFTYILARPKKRTIIYSVGLGFLMSVCSHGILAISMQLYKKGAATASVVSFLLSSPWANFPMTLLLVGFFGPLQAAYIIMVAIVVAMITGLLYQALERQGWVETNPRTAAVAEDFSIADDIRRRRKAYRFSVGQIRDDLRGIYQGSVALADMVLWWILLGIGLASLAGAYIPEHIFHKYMGPTVGGMLVTLAVATIVEVCSEGTAPLAFEIFRQTGALGNSFVFLMAGVATDYTEIGLIWANIGWRAAVWLPIITVPQILGFAYIANQIF